MCLGFYIVSLCLANLFLMNSKCCSIVSMCHVHSSIHLWKGILIAPVFVNYKSCYKYSLSTNFVWVQVYNYCIAIWRSIIASWDHIAKVRLIREETSTVREDSPFHIHWETNEKLTPHFKSVLLQVWPWKPPKDPCDKCLVPWVMQSGRGNIAWWDFREACHESQPWDSGLLLSSLGLLPDSGGE